MKRRWYLLLLLVLAAMLLFYFGRFGEEVRFPVNDLVVSSDFSRDGNLLAAGTNGGDLHVFDLIEGKELYRLQLGRLVDDIAFSPDQKWLVSTGNGAQVWNLENGDLESELINPENKSPGERAVCFSSSGRYLSIARGGKVEIWDFPNRKLLHTIGGKSILTKQNAHAELMCSGHGEAAFSTDDQLLAIGNHCGVRLHDVASGNLVGAFQYDREIHHERDIHLRGPWSAARFSNDGRKLFVAGEQSYVLYVTPKGDQFELEVITRGNGAGTNADISPDGNWLAKSSIGGIAIVDLQTGEDVRYVNTRRFALTGRSIYAVQFSHDGQRIAIGGQARNQMVGIEGFISVWRTSALGMSPSKQ